MNPGMVDENLYEILQVSPNAEQAVLDGAYRKLAAKYHPDVYKGADAQHRMGAINNAYETLSDPVKRTEYDRVRPMHMAATALPGTAGGSVAGTLRSFGCMTSIAISMVLSGISSFALHPGRSLLLLAAGVGMFGWMVYSASRTKPAKK